MTSELSFAWDDHQNTVIEKVKDLLLQDSLVDCTLAAGGQYLKAHKVILSACSPYFQLLFNQEKDKNPIVILKDVKFQELKYLIDFIYLGVSHIPADEVQGFLKVGQTLQITGLTDINYRETSEKFQSTDTFSDEEEENGLPVSRKRRKKKHENKPIANENSDEFENNDQCDLALPQCLSSLHSIPRKIQLNAALSLSRKTSVTKVEMQANNLNNVNSSDHNAEECFKTNEHDQEDSILESGNDNILPYEVKCESEVDIGETDWFVAPEEIGVQQQVNPSRCKTSDHRASADLESDQPVKDQRLEDKFQSYIDKKFSEVALRIQNLANVVNTKLSSVESLQSIAPQQPIISESETCFTTEAHPETEDNCVHLGNGIYISRAYADQMKHITESHSEWSRTLLEGVFGDRARKMRVSPRTAGLEKFSNTFLNVARAHYQAWLSEQKVYTVDEIHDLVKKLPGYLSDMCTNMSGPRGMNRKIKLLKQAGMDTSELVSMCLQRRRDENLTTGRAKRPRIQYGKKVLSQSHSQSLTQPMALAFPVGMSASASVFSDPSSSLNNSLNIRPRPPQSMNFLETSQNCWPQMGNFGLSNV